MPKVDSFFELSLSLARGHLRARISRHGIGNKFFVIVVICSLSPVPSISWEMVSAKALVILSENSEFLFASFNVN